MFLIRTAFWMGVVVLLLPTDKQQQAKLAATAGETIERVATFCNRNETACEKGAEYWATFVKKAEFGGRMALDLVNNRGQQSTEPARPETVSATDRTPKGTLKPADMVPGWRGNGDRTPHRTGA